MIFTSCMGKIKDEMVEEKGKQIYRNKFDVPTHQSWFALHTSKLLACHGDTLLIRLVAT